MSNVMEHNEDATKGAARKYRDVRHPAMKNTVKVPLALVAKAAVSEAPPRYVAATGVDLARNSAETDANAALMKLRELVVGPTQQLNEARLEELMKIFDEREAELRAVMRDLQKRNSELEVALKQTSLDQLNAFKAEFQSLTDGMTIESKKVFSSIREELNAVRKEGLSLVQDAKDVADQKLEAQHLRTKGLVEGEIGKLRLDLASVSDTLETAMTLSQRETQNNISRVLKDASEHLARVAHVS